MSHRPFFRLGLLGAICLLFSGKALADLGYLVSDPDYDRDYILAGDSENPARNGLAVRESVLIVTNSDTPTELADYRFAWELEIRQSDGSWSQVPLVGSDTFVTSSQPVVLTNDPSDETPSFANVQFNGALEPTTPLDPYAEYRVTGQLQRKPLFGSYADVEPLQFGDADTFYQFTNTTSGDDARNIIAVLETATLSNPFLLDGASDSAKRGFTVDLSATAHRWDDYNSGITSGFVRFRYDVVLREKGTGNVVPLQNTFFQQLVRVPTYAEPGNEPFPSEKDFNETLTLIPAEQLDPVNKQYEVDVTITHEENPVTNTFLAGNTRSLEDLRLYDFNGELHFNGRVTRLENFTRNPQPSTTDGASYVAMTLNNVDGHLDGLPDYTYDAPGSVSIRLLDTGTATVQSLGANVPVTPPNTPDTGTAAGIRFQRENILLQTTGLSSDLTVFLPQGMGYVPVGGNDRRLAGTINFPGVDLSAQLAPQPVSLDFTPSAPVRVFEESKPAYVSSDRIVWETSTGEFTLRHASADAGYTRAAEADYLENAPVDTELKTKADNSGYYSALSGVDGTSSLIKTKDGAAQMDVAYNLTSGFFKTHFPYGVEVSHSGGDLDVKDDAVENGSINLSDTLTLSYNQTCAGVECGLPKEDSLEVAPGTLEFTHDGGLVGKGPLQGPDAERQLSWGYIDALSSPGSPVYAQQLSAFSEATFHATGHFIQGEGGSFAAFNPGGPGDIAARNAPANTLLAAVEGPTEAESGNMARPGSNLDQEGNYYYAGLNLETSGDGAVTGLATIAGVTVPYNLRGCNKFYVRQVGVTGTVEAVRNSFAQNLQLNGYDFTFNYYGLGYLDSETSPSRSFTKGSLATPAPTDSTFAFEGLSFTCLGALDEARLPDGGLATVFDYWNADIDIASLTFTSSGGCNPGDPAFLTLGATGYSTLIDQPLHGTVGIRPNGRLVNRYFSNTENLETEITSRFRLPNNLKLDGPKNEQYSLTTVSEAYLNNYDATSEQSLGDGRLNFAAKIDVPFFEDLAAHVRTTASKNTNPNAVIDLMGGWTEGGQTYFSTAFFDTMNRGFPAGVDEALYRNESGASGNPKPYLIHARQEWLNVVPFDYTLDWSSSLRSFSGYEAVKDQDLLIITLDHQLDYLSADRAHITFGAQYDGLPRINLTNIVFNKIEEETGVLEAAKGALTGKAVEALDTGTKKIDALLDDQIDALIENFMTGEVDPIIDSFYSELQAAAQSSNTVATWQTEVEDKTEKYFIQNTVLTSDDLPDAIQKLGGPLNEGNSVVKKVDTSLKDLQIALRSVHGRTYLKDGTVQLEEPSSGDFDTLDGLLYQENGKFPVIEKLIAGLIDEVGGDIADGIESAFNSLLSSPTGGLENLIGQQVERVSPSLERIRMSLARLDDRIGAIRDRIEATTAFAAEFADILNAADSQIQTAAAELRSAVEAFILEQIPAPERFDEYTAQELQQRIRAEVKDKIRGMRFIREFHQVIRQELYDVNLAIKEGIDSAFAQVNVALKNMLSQSLRNYDESIEGVRGDINSVVAGGQFDGFAHINGDALRLLRVDATIQFKVPKEMEFEGYFQIKQLASDGTGSCSYDATDTPTKETTLAAPAIPLEWPGSDMTAMIEGKVTQSDRPLGLGGKIELVSGSFGFEAFTINEMAAVMSFGPDENYLAAELGMAFSSFEVYGGVFFGRTCSITPVELVNEEAASVIGPPDPTFTGAYVYGEAHVSITEVLLGIPATCFLNLTAGSGYGIFYFTEGNSFGGQIKHAISGEALCLVNVNGEVSLIGAKVGKDLRFRGRGTVGGSVGICPTCVKFSKSLILEYINDRWKFQL